MTIHAMGKVIQWMGKNLDLPWYIRIMSRIVGERMQMSTVEQTLARLQKSAFRAKFHLMEKDKKYIRDKGMDTIRRHAADFVRTRLAPAYIPNDGRQTPMRGHPVFVAQHACACCCRGCLAKWYHIPSGRFLTLSEQERIVKLLTAWIERQLED